VETIGSKRSYALTWCMPNNDDDDDVIIINIFAILFTLADNKIEATLVLLKYLSVL